MFPSQFTQVFSTWPCKLLSTYKRQLDTVWHRHRNEWHRPGLPKTAILLMTPHHQTVRKSYFIECTDMHKRFIWIIHAKVSTIFKHAIVYGIKYYISMNTCRHRAKLMQLALLKTQINKPQSTHATHNLITSEDSKTLELFEVGLFFHKPYVGRWVKPY